MFIDWLSTAYLASCLLIPMTLKIRGCKFNSLFESSRSKATRFFSGSVVVLQFLALVAWKTKELRFFGESVVLWAILLLLCYFWIRTFMLVVTYKQT